ncbi:unnamed protein product, partial [Rotaria sordida]
ENENSKIRSIKRQATSQTQYDSENEDSILFIDNENENDRFTMVKKNQNNQKRKIQRGEEQHVYNLDQLDESSTISFVFVLLE